jgi:transcriptional regulator of acetoin/glycerol metabolism
MKKISQINYKQIYADILSYKYPEKIDKCRFFLEKDSLSSLEVIQLNTLIFGKNNTSTFNGMYRAYSKETMLKILEYQKVNRLNNTQLAKYFGLSRNTVAKWKKQFYIILKN